MYLLFVKSICAYLTAKITWFVTQFNIFLASILQQASQSFLESSFTKSLLLAVFTQIHILKAHTKMYLYLGRGSQKVLSLK